MFETLRGILKGSIEKNSILVKIEEKLHTFLNDNPDVDHYISDKFKTKNRANFWFGLLLGILFTVIISSMIFMFCMVYWNGTGCLHFPGVPGWD